MLGICMVLDVWGRDGGLLSVVSAVATWVVATAVVGKMGVAPASREATWWPSWSICGWPRSSILDFLKARFPPNMTLPLLEKVNWLRKSSSINLSVGMVVVIKVNSELSDLPGSIGQGSSIEPISNPGTLGGERGSSRLLKDLVDPAPATFAFFFNLLECIPVRLLDVRTSFLDERNWSVDILTGVDGSVDEEERVIGDEGMGAALGLSKNAWGGSSADWARLEFASPATTSWLWGVAKLFPSAKNSGATVAGRGSVTCSDAGKASVSATTSAS